MSNTDLESPVLVGVDGSDEAFRALDWAAVESANHDRALRVVYVRPDEPATWPVDAAVRPSPSEQGELVLAEARERAAAAHPGLSVSIAQIEGKPPQVLLEESRQARMLVVGREGMGRFAELVFGSVSLAVASRATVPVAVIPASWVRPPEPYGRIVCGIDGSQNCRTAAEFAFEIAAERNAELVVAYAWHQPLNRPDSWPLGTEDPHVKADFERALATVIDDLRAKYPDVPVEVVDEVEHPALVLGRQASNADVVVIGGRGHGAVTGMLLGSVAHAIIRHLDRPVIVVHSAATVEGT